VLSPWLVLMALARAMIECWHPDPTARPTFASLLAQLKEIELSEHSLHDPAIAMQLQVSPSVAWLILLACRHTYF